MVLLTLKSYDNNFETELLIDTVDTEEVAT